MLSCCVSVARQVPINYILLFAFTLCESYMVAAVCAFTKPELVGMAALMTLGICLALFVYALTTKTDFTTLGGVLFVCCFGLFIVGIFLMFTNNNTAHIIYSGLGVILFGFYLIYDV